MSPAMSALSSVGITHSMLLLGVLFVIVAVILGMYWHIIVPGAVMLTVAFLFIEPATVAKTDEPTKVEQAKTPAIDEDKMAFMEDCVVVADYPKEKCERLWAERLLAEKEMANEAKPVDVSYKRQSRQVKYH
jgi:predicted membrane protein